MPVSTKPAPRLRLLTVFWLNECRTGNAWDLNPFPLVHWQGHVWVTRWTPRLLVLSSHIGCVQHTVPVPFNTVNRCLSMRRLNLMLCCERRGAL